MGVPQGGQGMNQWKGKTAFITGASNGIGAAIATRLLAEGMRVVGAARRQGRVAKILQQADASGANSLAVECDVRDECSVHEAFSLAKKAFGGVDVLVNNAGLGHAATLAEGKVDE